MTDRPTWFDNAMTAFASAFPGGNVTDHLDSYWAELEQFSEQRVGSALAKAADHAEGTGKIPLPRQVAAIATRARRTEDAEPEPWQTEPEPVHEPTRVENALLEKWSDEDVNGLSSMEVARRRARDCYEAIASKGESLTEDPNGDQREGQS